IFELPIRCRGRAKLLPNTMRLLLIILLITDPCAPVWAETQTEDCKTGETDNKGKTCATENFEALRQLSALKEERDRRAAEASAEAKRELALARIAQEKADLLIKKVDVITEVDALKEEEKRG